MKKLQNFLIAIAVILLSAVSMTTPAFAENYSDPIFPGDLIIKDTYEPGNGQPVAMVRKVSGTVVVVHEQQDKKEEFGYRVSAKLDLYKGDTIYTAADGHIAIKLNDNSFTIPLSM